MSVIMPNSDKDIEHRFSSILRELNLDVSDALLQELWELEDINHALDAASIVAIADAYGRIKYVNDKFEEISGYRKEELIGKTHKVVNSGYHDEAFFKEMWESISVGKIWNGDIKNKRKDGSEYWVNTTIVPFINEGDTHPYQYVSIRTDISKRKEAEELLKEKERQLQVQALVTGRLSALAELSGGIAHELNQPLSGIRMYSMTIENLLKLPDPNLEKVTELLGKVKKQVDRASTIIQHIRDFSSEKGHAENEKVILNDVIDCVIDLIGQQLKSHNIKFINKLPDQLTVMANFNRLEQVFINLMSNARDSYTLNTVQNKCIELRAWKNNGKVFIELEDNGIGIKEEIKDKIFEPFITSKGPDKGTGLGLSICHGILRDYNGSIKLKKSDENGTCFIIQLETEVSDD